MKGSPAHQVKNLYLKSGIDQIGTSKHEAKAIARENIATGGNRSQTWHEVGKQLGIHSYATQNAYRDTWRHVLQYSRENFQIRDIEKITGEHVSAYLESKIADGVKHATFAQYASAVEKLETALNMYSSSHDRGKTYSFSEAIKPVREQAAKNLEHFNGHREYREPAKVINEIKKDTYKIVAKLQYEAGLRIKETNMIRASQLLPGNRLRVEGGKGGKVRIVSLPADVYQKLKTAVNDADGVLKFKKNTYRQALKRAVVAAGETYKGKSTHGLRWTYAQQKFQEYQLSQQKETYEEAEQHISDDLGHNRSDVTQHYLGH